MASVQAVGIDVGSTTVKLTGIDADGQMIWCHLEQADPRAVAQIERLLAETGWTAAQAGGTPLVATGCGRRLVEQATRQITEITCHAAGIYRELGHGGTLVDIGGQDSKVIRISPEGKVLDFAMNDKCAAGTGRFLENTASRLGVPLEQMGNEALSGSEEAVLSSTCTVFAESEVISLLASGVEVPPILRGLHRALLKRISAMIRTVGLQPPLMLSGGVARNPAISALLAEEMGVEVLIPPAPQLMGAYGAALLALDGKGSH